MTVTRMVDTVEALGGVGGIPRGAGNAERRRI